MRRSYQSCLLHLRQFYPEEMLQDSESPVGCSRMEADGELKKISGEDYIFQLLSFWFHCYCLMNCVRSDPSDWKAASQWAPKCTDKVNGCCQCTLSETYFFKCILRRASHFVMSAVWFLPSAEDFFFCDSLLWWLRFLVGFCVLIHNDIIPVLLVI